jgi:hypothetical protein
MIQYHIGGVAILLAATGDSPLASLEAATARP